jgi:hypothetical protein
VTGPATGGRTVPVPAGSGGPAALDRVADLVGRLRRVPDEAREFELSAETAVDMHRLPVELIEMSVACGLPYRGDGADRRFDRCDLATISMHLGVGSAAHAMRIFLPRTLATTDRRPGRYRLGYLPDCPEPGHAGGCGYTLRVPGGVRECRVPASGREPLLELTVSLVEPRVELPGPVRELLAELAGYEFALLPDRVRRDPDLIARTGLADCTGLSGLLASELRRRGLACRRSYGLLLSPPFVSRHYWAELRLGERWVPLDPVLLGTMARWGVLDPGAWPPTRSLGAVLWRVADDVVPLSVHGRVPTRAPFRIQVLP